MQKSVTFVKNNFKMNMPKIKKYFEVRNHCLKAGEYKGAAHSICSFKYSVPKEVAVDPQWFYLTMIIILS